MLQNFNYHTHTSRSGHSQFISDEDILSASINSGFTTIGFSEHLSYPPTVLPEEDERMLFSEIEEYITSINNLKQKYPNITILTGFEIEFDPMKESYIGSMKEKVDYMILGQRTVQRGLSIVDPTNNPNYPIEYANMVINALDSGIFDIVSHPDIFMKYRDTMESEESKRLFDENSEIASQVICEKASEMGVPIEINLSSNKKTLSDGNLEYPHPLFWQIASEIDGLQVLYGVGAHRLEDFEKLEKSYNKVSEITSLIQDKLVSNDYNPVIARQNNEILNEAYKKGQARALSFETLMSNETMNSCLNDEIYEFDSQAIAEYIAGFFNMASQSCTELASQKDNMTLEEVTSLSTDSSLSIEEKLGKLERKKKTINETNQALANQQALMEKIKNTMINAMKMGCNSKEEIINIATQLIEHDTTLNDEQKAQIVAQVNRFAKLKNSMANDGSSKRLTNPNYGFTNVALITLILSFVFGVGVGIAYMLIQLG